MRNNITPEPIISAAVLPDVRVLTSALLLLVLILTSITGAVSAPAG